MKDEQTIKFYGLRLEPLSLTDYRFGNANGVEDSIYLENIDWFPYKSNSEKQRKRNIETLACVTFSAINQIEIILNYKLIHGLIDPVDVEWAMAQGYIENGRWNFSDRFTAKMSGTSKSGNSPQSVAYSIHNDGLVPESKWPFLEEFDWDNYYVAIPKYLIDLGKEFKKRFPITYEFVVSVSQFQNQMHYNPLQLIGHAWDAPVNGIYAYSNGTWNHAFTGCKVFPDQKYGIEDHYEPFEKILAKNFSFYPQATKYYVNNKLTPMTKQKIYKTATSPKCYEFWGDGDGLYHWINEKWIINKYGGWANVEIVTVAEINQSKVGSPIGEFTGLITLILNLSNSIAAFGKKGK